MTWPTPYYLFVPGVRTNTADDGWHDRAERWIEANTPSKAGVYEYETAATLRWWGQRRRVKELAERIGDLCRDGGEIVLVGHSNGCQLITEALSHVFPAVERVVMFAPAVDHDMARNGWNGLLDEFAVGRLAVYGSPDDAALKLATWSSRLFGWAGMGYGDLGRVGPTNLSPSVASRVAVDLRTGHGHSTWFRPDLFDATMGLITEGSSR